jgi:hypothetical protein
MHRRRETLPPVTMGHIRSHGVTRLLVYCGNAGATTARRSTAISCRMRCRWGRCAGAWSARTEG